MCTWGIRSAPSHFSEPTKALPATFAARKAWVAHSSSRPSLDVAGSFFAGMIAMSACVLQVPFYERLHRVRSSSAGLE